MFSDSSFFEKLSILILKLQKVLASFSSANLSLIFQFFVISFKFKKLSTQFENKFQSHVHTPHSPRLASLGIEFYKSKLTFVKVSNFTRNLKCTYQKS
jgi:hypothetical protein